MVLQVDTRPMYSARIPIKRLTYDEKRPIIETCERGLYVMKRDL